MSEMTRRSFLGSLVFAPAVAALKPRTEITRTESKIYPWPAPRSIQRYAIDFRVSREVLEDASDASEFVRQIRERLHRHAEEDLASRGYQIFHPTDEMSKDFDTLDLLVQHRGRTLPAPGVRNWLRRFVDGFKRNDDGV